MSSQEMDVAPEADQAEQAGHDNEAVANKLSTELSNWRRRRSHGRPRREQAQTLNYQSEAARTIKLRGHETLVVRKPKLAKPTQP